MMKQETGVGGSPTRKTAGRLSQVFVAGHSPLFQVSQQHPNKRRRESGTRAIETPFPGGNWRVGLPLESGILV